MDAAIELRDGMDPAPFDILLPPTHSAPLVVASPHSGREYSPAFLAASRLDLKSLRRSEDCFVDELFGAAPRLGAPLIRARFPRTFIDPNREPYELDPAMFSDALPPYANSASTRVSAGLGTIPRVVTNGEEIYRGKLRFAEARERVERYYRPYHEAMAGLVDDTRKRFGVALLIDGHSMPSVGGPMERDAGRRRVDFVLGDCHGSACDPALVDAADQALTAKGYNVTRNVPYAGGFTTRHYGRPGERAHALQIEVNRALYMDEERFEKRPSFVAIARDLGDMLRQLARLLLGQAN